MTNQTAILMSIKFVVLVLWLEMNLPEPIAHNVSGEKRFSGKEAKHVSSRGKEPHQSGYNQFETRFFCCFISIETG